MIDWFTTTITSTPKGLPVDTLTLHTTVGNAAAVFAQEYGAVTRRARHVGCSRQTVYDHARRVERRLSGPPAEPAATLPAATLDDATRRRFAVTAVALGLSTRQVEELLRIVVGDDGPDHATVGRWVAEAAAQARGVLQALDAACAEAVTTLAVDEVYLGEPRRSSPSSR